MKNPFFVTLCLLYCSVICSQSTFYVSTNGSNSNSGLSLAQAWQTIEHAANSNMVTPGSTVLIEGGIYTETFSFGINGTTGNPIIFKALDNNEVAIDGANVQQFGAIIIIRNTNHLRLENLTIRNTEVNYAKGIFIDGGSDNIEIVNCKIHDIHFSNNPDPNIVTSNHNSNPIVVFNYVLKPGSTTEFLPNPDPCTNIIFENNEVYNNRTGYSEAMTMAGNIDGFIIQNNTIHDNTNIGIDAVGGYGADGSNASIDFVHNGVIRKNKVYNCVSPYAVSAGIYVDGAKDILIEHNICYQNGRGFEIGAEQQDAVAENITMRNNISYQNLEAGMGIGGYEFPTTGKVANCTVKHNTFYGNNTIGKYEGELLIEYAEDCSIKNNIFYATNTRNVLLVGRLPSKRLDLDYNLYYHNVGANNVFLDFQLENESESQTYDSFSEYQAMTGQDQNSVFAEPELVDPSNVDFYIQPTSPAVNQGDPNFIPAPQEKDYAGADRVLNSRTDMGAYEFSTILAVDNISWGGIAKSEQIELTWALPQGTDYQFIEVEKSWNSLDFITLQEIPIYNQNNSYSFIDTHPQAGMNYYRLHFKNEVGTSDFSSILAIDFKAPTVQIYPNPTSYYLDIKNSPQDINWTLRNSNGKTVATFKLLPFLIRHLEQGVYILEGRKESGDIFLVRQVVIL